MFFFFRQDWFLGESDDPLNVPFALFIYRYSTPGEAVSGALSAWQKWDRDPNELYRGS